MATGASGDGLLRCVFEGCIAASDAAKERRPYHRNCGCALHHGRGRGGPCRCDRTVSYPIRRSWSGTHLAAAGQHSSSSSASSPSTPADSSDAKAIGRSGSCSDIASYAGTKI